MLTTQGDLFDPPPVLTAVAPWRPRPLTHEQWPADYRAVFAWRLAELDAYERDPTLLDAAKRYYATHPVEFITHWCDTFNPRKSPNHKRPELRGPKWMPFVLFDRQREFIEFVEHLRHESENGLVEKCRDVGASWLGVAYTVWSFIILENDSSGWGSRKEDYVDKKGEPDSLFEKMRLLIDRLPPCFRPKVSGAFMKMLNKDNGATISGEAGDGIGRGGRKSRFWVDEAAHIERAELIEASLGDTTDVRIDMSSVNGYGNMFHRRREAGEIWTPGCKMDRGVVRVFIFDWRDHPEKTQEWYDARKAKHVREGTQHIFAQEVDRNYSAAVDNTVIAMEWIEACVDAHLYVPALQVEQSGEWMAGLDVADEGGDKNALALRNGVVLRHVEEWGERDPGVTTRRLLQGLRVLGRRGLTVQYDCIGIGAAVKAEYNSLVERGEITYSEFQMVPWHAGASVAEPFAHVVPDDDQSSLNRDFFANMKAQAWWAFRTRCYKTWRARKQGEVYRADELVSIDSAIPGHKSLMKELAQPIRATATGSLRMRIDKAPGTTKSPNMADSVIMAFFPAPSDGSSVSIGSYSGG